MIKGAVFDADGTLLDSMHIWDELGERFLTLEGINPEPGLSNILYSMSLKESSAYIKQKYRLQQSESQITANILELIRSFYLHEVTLKSGVLSFLEFLRSHRIPMIVVTSNKRDILFGCFKRLGINGFFTDIVTCDDLNLSKREPTIYSEAANRLGFLPSECVVFEDVLYGISAAKSAGFLTVAVADFSNVSSQSELCAEANCFIKDFSDKKLKNFLQE